MGDGWHLERDQERTGRSRVMRARHAFARPCMDVQRLRMAARLIRLNPRESAVPSSMDVGWGIGALAGLRRIQGEMERLY